MTTDRKIFDFLPRRGIMIEIEYPGVAQLVGRHIWDVEAGRSSRPTRTKSPLKSAISEDFFFVYCAPSTAVPKLSERLRLCLYFRRSLSCVYSGLQIFFPWLAVFVHPIYDFKVRIDLSLHLFLGHIKMCHNRMRDCFNCTIPHTVAEVSGVINIETTSVYNRSHHSFTVYCLPLRWHTVSLIIRWVRSGFIQFSRWFRQYRSVNLL